MVNSVYGIGSEVMDNNLKIVDNVDPTKKLQWEISGIASGTTVVMTAPTSDFNFNIPVFGVTTVDKITIDNIVIDANDISSSSGNLTITPVAGSAVVIDGGASFDGTVLTGLTALTSTAITGTLQTATQGNIDHDSLANFLSTEHFLQSAITTVGTIASGTWQSTDIGVAYGGTGTSTGSITGTGALIFAAGGSNQNITLTPSGTGIILLNGRTNFSNSDVLIDRAINLLQVGVRTSNTFGGVWDNLSTSSTDSIDKYGLIITSSGTWNGSGANNYGLKISVNGGTTNWGIYVTGENKNYFSGNVGVGVETFGTSAVKVLGLATGTVPSTSPIDMIQIFSVDAAGAGTASLGLRTEQSVAADADETKFSNKLAVTINGTLYYLMLTTS